MMQMKNGKYFVTNPDYKLRDVAGEYLLIPVGKELKNFNGLGDLNETGFYLWRLLEKPIKYEDIISSFASEYKFSEDMQKDIDEFLDKAIERNAVLISDSNQICLIAEKKPE